MVLNSLEIDPGKTWKGVWRWYSDEMLECCAPLSAVKQRGINFSEFACLAKCNGLKVTSKRWDRTTKAVFDEDLHRASKSANTHLVVSFSRKIMGQTGVGHFSPVGAYHPRRNLALILDVARFKYPCYWAPVDLLWEAMAPPDPDTGKSRGYFLLSHGDRKSQTFLRFSPKIPWSQLCALVCDEIPSLLSLQQISSHREAISLVLQRLPKDILCFVSEGVDLAGPGLRAEFVEDLRKVKAEVASLPLFNLISEITKGSTEQSLLLTILLVACPERMIAPLRSQHFYSELMSLRRHPMSELLSEEVKRLENQLDSMNENCVCYSK